MDPAEIQERIEELRQNLRDTDWIVVEILESQIVASGSPRDFDEVHDKRKGWREEIKNLLAQMNELKKEAEENKENN